MQVPVYDLQFYMSVANFDSFIPDSGIQSSNIRDVHVRSCVMITCPRRPGVQSPDCITALSIELSLILPPVSSCPRIPRLLVTREPLVQIGLRLQHSGNYMCLCIDRACDVAGRNETGGSPTAAATRLSRCGSRSEPRQGCDFASRIRQKAHNLFVCERGCDPADAFVMLPDHAVSRSIAAATNHNAAPLAGSGSLGRALARLICTRRTTRYFFST